MLYVSLTIKLKVGIPESFKVGWYPHKITGSSQLKAPISGALARASRARSGTPWVRKFGKLSIRENLVMT